MTYIIPNKITLNNFKFSGLIEVEENLTFNFDDLIIEKDDKKIPLEEIKGCPLFYDDHYMGLTVQGELENIALYNLGKQKGFSLCQVSNLVFETRHTVLRYDGKRCNIGLVELFEVDGKYYPEESFHWQKVRDASGIRIEFIPDAWANMHHYCEHCGAYLIHDNDYVGNCLCHYCDEKMGGTL